MKIAPYGSWRSPIAARDLAHGGVRFGFLTTDGESVYWTEWRPEEGGRNQIVRWNPEDGSLTDLLPESFSARSRVHEYGGAEFLAEGGRVLFVQETDQRLYRIEAPGAKPVPLTPEGFLRFADGIVDSKRERYILVCEDHSTNPEPRNTLVAVSAEGGTVRTLVTGFDFVSSPRLAPGGDRLAWLGWYPPGDALGRYPALDCTGGRAGTAHRRAPDRWGS
ncbi:MAG: hypothetical protein KatS3mg115_1969 [Candidatus Poribacteria bacterium]|nr:MAG: hypothetical protein KatS3mg115_1969 [Candidatus Poribacteria bacterium]